MRRTPGALKPARSGMPVGWRARGVAPAGASGPAPGLPGRPRGLWLRRSPVRRGRQDRTGDRTASRRGARRGHTRSHLEVLRGTSTVSQDAFPSGVDVHSAHASGRPKDPRRRGCGQLRAVMRAGSGRRRWRHETTGAKVVSRVLSARRNARFPALRGLEPFPVAAGHQVPILNRRGPARPRRATAIRTTDPRTCSPRRRTGPRPTGPRADSPPVRPSR